MNHDLIVGGDLSSFNAAAAAAAGGGEARATGREVIPDPLFDCSSPVSWGSGALWLDCVAAVRSSQSGYA